jgi:hypothetical protein
LGRETNGASNHGKAIMATEPAKIGLAVERCRELLDLARRNKCNAKHLSTAIFGYFEAFAVAGIKENEIPGQLPIAIPCNPGVRRGFLKAIGQQLERETTSEDVLAPLLEGGKLNEETVAAIRLDVERLTAPPKKTLTPRTVK